MQVETQRFRRLAEGTAEMLASEGRPGICHGAIETVERVLADATALVLLYDREKEGLVSVASTPNIRGCGALSGPYTDRNSVAWRAYTNGDPIFLDDPSTAGGAVAEMGMASGFCLPLGNHGAFLVGTSTDTETAAPDELDGYLLRILASVLEIALDREERKRGLKGVQEITREILTADSPQTLAETVVAMVPDALDLPVSTIWEWQPGSKELVPVATSEKADDLFEEIPTFDSEGGLTWQSFHAGETRVYEDVGSHPEAYNENSPIGSEIIVPLGEFGVLATGSTHRGSFTQTERRLLEGLGANIVTAIHLLNRRRELSLQDQVLARILRHNIRNDLTAIQGFASEIQRQSDGTVADYAASIVDRCDGLERTASHAREMQQIVRRNDQQTEIELRPTVGWAIQRVREEYSTATIDLECPASPTVSAHPDLGTAIRHLIENGIVHHPGHGESDAPDPQVMVIARSTEKGPEVEIADEAGGIPETELTVLERDEETSLQHGSGAGLWIVNRVVKYSGAQLTFNTDEEGTIVRIAFA